MPPWGGLGGRGKAIIGKILFPAVVLLLSVAAFTGSDGPLFYPAGCLLALTLVFRQWGILNAALLLFMIALGAYLPASSFLNLPVIKSLFPLLASSLLALPFLKMSGTFSWIKAGKPDGRSILIMSLAVVFSAAALIWWARWAAN